MTLKFDGGDSGSAKVNEVMVMPKVGSGGVSVWRECEVKRSVFYS
jgi:hypothetical protein